MRNICNDRTLMQVIVFFLAVFFFADTENESSDSFRATETTHFSTGTMDFWRGGY